MACFVQQAERRRVWQGIRVSMAHKLTGIWDEPGIRAWLKQVMPNMFTSSTFSPITMQVLKLYSLCCDNRAAICMSYCDIQSDLQHLRMCCKSLLPLSLGVQLTTAGIVKT